MLTNVSIENAHKIILKEKINTQIIEVNLLDSLGHALAENIVSDINMPPFDRSPLDGYAFRSVDTLNASQESPVSLEVIDNIQAGFVSHKTIQEGQAIRIMTGAKIPKGADLIMRYEDTQFTDRQVTIFKSLKANSNIVKTGEDMEIGDRVLEKDIVIGPAEIGVLASLGKSQVRVYSKPRIAILATGDELVSIDSPLEEGKIRNSNSYFLAAQINKLGARAIILPVCKDTIEETKKALESSLTWADMIITTGGASVGDADIIKEAFTEAGASILFWKVEMKPGSPIICAKYENKFLFGLSGNPAAAYITFEKFVAPTVLRLMGKSKTELMKVDSILESDFLKVSSQNRYVRAYTYKKNGKYYTILPDKHSSGVLSNLAGKNSLFFVASNTGPFSRGERVEVELLNYLEVGK